MKDFSELRRLCREIDEGYESGLSMLDDEMNPLAQDLLDKTDEIAELVEFAEAAVPALLQVQRLIKEAHPQFNWGASALDANAIGLLNETPGMVDVALRRVPA